MKKENLGLIYAGFTSILWGFLAVFLKFSLVDLDSITIVWFRFSFAFVVLFSILYFKKNTSISILKKPPILIIFAGIALGFNYLFFMLGLNYTNPTITNIVIQIGPVLLAGVGIYIYKEKVSLKQVFGFIFVIFGFILFLYDQVNNASFIYKDLNLGLVLIIIAAVSWVLYASFQKRLSTDYEPQQLNLIIYLIPMIMFAPFVNFGSFLNLNQSSTLVLLFLGVNTLLAYGFIGEALKYAPANKVSVIITLNPIITITTMAILDKFNYVWLGKEATSLFGYIGAILVILGAILAIYKGK